jgi:fucose permease
MAIASIVLVGLGFANIFPLVFSIAVNRMPERSNEISGLMVTAIVGGAILPPMMGLLADATSVTIGFLVPLACALYLTYVSLVSLKLRPIAHEI